MILACCQSDMQQCQRLNRLYRGCLIYLSQDNDSQHLASKMRHRPQILFLNGVGIIAARNHVQSFLAAQRLLGLLEGYELGKGSNLE